ncbi:hypothetical protein OAS27_04430 [Alphaproteobacteria bacterium]|nr:hypothetical protein [Alphaproteobacteria bacterium]
MPLFSSYILALIISLFSASAAVSVSKADINATGVICGLEDGYDYGYSFTNEGVLRYTFIVTDDKILPNIKPLGPFTDKSDYIEWNVHFSNTTFRFRLNLATLILTTQSEEANLKFNHQCEIYELTQWNRKLSELEHLYQSEYDTYLEFSDEYNKSLKHY